MALLYRKIVRDAILEILSERFNQKLAALATAYGTVPFELDFASDSRNFAVAHIQPENIELSQLQEQVGACLYTSDALDQGVPRAFPFAGALLAHLDFFVRRRDGAEPFDSESYFDCIEDAAMSLLNDPQNQWPAGVILSRQTQCTREHLIPLGDGFGTRIPITAKFEVKVAAL